MSETTIKVSTSNPHSVSELTLQCGGALIHVAQMRHAEVGEWKSGHMGLFAGTRMTTFRSFDYSDASQALLGRVIARALCGLDFKRAA